MGIRMITGDPPSRTDAALIDRRWRTHWGDRIPSSTRIGSRWGDDVQRVPVLPAGKRYPPVDGEVDQLIDTVLAVVTAALGPPPVLLVTHGWLTDATGRPTRDVFLATHSPDARFWRSDDLAVQAGFSSLVHSFFQVLRSPEQARPVIDLHACDNTDDVFLADLGMRTLVVLRNEWVEVVPSCDHTPRP